MFPSEIATLKKFFSEQYGIFDIKSNFQHNFRVPVGFVHSPSGALYPVGDGTHSFVPIRNKFLATPLPNSHLYSDASAS